MSILYIRDNNTRKIFGLEEGYSSLVWTERYQEAGDFVLEIPLNVAKLDWYIPGNYITLDDSEESMIIEARTIDDDYEEPLLKVTGRSLSSLLNRRVNASRCVELQAVSEYYNGVITYSGSANSILNSIIEDELHNPILNKWNFFHKGDGSAFDEIDRQIPTENLVEGFLEPPGSLTAGPNPRWHQYNEIRYKPVNASYRTLNEINFVSNIPENVTIDSTFTKVMTIYDLFVKLSLNNYFGFKSYFNDNDEIVVEAYQGVDRSPENGSLSPVIFNPIMDNVTRLNYFEDYSEYKTTGFVYTDSYLNYYPKTGDKTIDSGYAWVKDNSLSGLNRYCVELDASGEVSFSSLQDNPDLEAVGLEDSSDGSETGDEELVTYADWRKYYNACVEKLSNVGNALFDEGEYKIVRTSEGEVDPLVRYRYGEDYFMGDKVNISDERGNIYMTAYIDEVVRSYDENGIITTPNFKNVLDYDDGREDET